MNKYIKFSSPFIFLISLIFILIFKTVPSGKLWHNYSVLCVPKSADDAAVMSAISKSGIENVVSLSGQFLPIALSENSIEISMLRLNYDSKDYSYLAKRNAMFFDKSNSYRLYYIPVEYSSQISSVMKTLEGQGISCMKDSSANYPWLLPFIAILLTGMLFLFSRHKLMFLSVSIFPLVFLYSNPFYPVATATCLVLLCLFFASNVWRRKGAVSNLLGTKAVPAMLAIAFICAFSSSVSSGFLFLVSSLGTASSLVIYYYAETFIRSKKTFVPVYIRSAKRVSFFAGKTFTSMSIVTGAVLLFVVLIFLTGTDSLKNTSSNLLFPGASKIDDSSLPQFEEFYKWNWNVRTYPFKTLNSGEVSENEVVTFSDFSENEETGIISENIKTMQYDDSFRREVYDGIDNLQFDSVEKIMKSEGENFTAGYTAASSYQINLFGIIMCFICLFILLFIYFSIIIRKGINK